MRKKSTPSVLLKKISKQATGFIDKLPTIYDYVQGLETGIAYEVLNPSGDWTDSSSNSCFGASPAMRHSRHRYSSAS